MLLPLTTGPNEVLYYNGSLTVVWIIVRLGAKSAYIDNTLYSKTRMRVSDNKKGGAWASQNCDSKSSIRDSFWRGRN